MEAPNAYTQVTGDVEAIGVVDSNHNKFDFSNQTMENKSKNLSNGDSFEECLTDVHTHIWIGDVSIDIGSSTVSNMLFEPSQEVHDNNRLIEDVCKVDSTHDDAYHSVSDDDSTSYQSVDFKPRNLNGSEKF